MATMIRTTPGYRPCKLPYHRPGQRVSFQQWDVAKGRMHTHTGTVVAHEDRQLTIRLDSDRGTVSTSCGHVVKARRSKTGEDTP